MMPRPSSTPSSSSSTSPPSRNDISSTPFHPNHNNVPPHSKATIPTTALATAGNSTVKNLSCLQCRRRKTRCDKKYPCSPCQIRGEQSSCTQVQQTIASIPSADAAVPLTSASDSSVRSTSSALSAPTTLTEASTSALANHHASKPTQDLQALRSPTQDDPHSSSKHPFSLVSRGANLPNLSEERLLRLETRMQRVEAILASAHQDPSNPLNLLHDVALASLPPPQASSEYQNSTKDRPYQSDIALGEGIQDLFEDAVMGHRIKIKSLPPLVRDIATTISYGKRATYKDAQEDEEDEDDDDDDDEVLNQRSPDSNADLAYRFAQFLPSDPAPLLQFYFTHVDWTARTLSPDAQSIFHQLAKLSAEEIAAFPISSAHVCCYFIVLALALHFADEQLLHRVNLNPRTACKLADTLCTGSQQLLWASNFLQSRQLEHLSCVCLLGVYQYSRKEQSDSQWALLGSATKVAQALGLCRLDYHTPNSPANTWIANQNPLRRELARRIWCNLVWHDWSHAAAHFGIYSINPTHNHTHIPANVDINPNDSTVTLHHPDVYTHSSAIIMRMRYVTVYREIIDHSNQHGDFTRAQIQVFVDKLNEVHDTTPACLAYSPHRTFERPDQAMESIMLEINYHTRILRLHRVHQLSGFTHHEWRFARKACLASAHSIIRVLSLQTYDVIHKFWVTTFYLLGASMTLVMELCCAHQDDEVDVSSIRRSISCAISLLSKAGRRNEAARNSKRILKELLGCEERIRQAFARSGGLESITHENRDRFGTSDVFLEILRKIFRPSAPSAFPSPSLKRLGQPKRGRADNDPPETATDPENPSHTRPTRAAKRPRCLSRDNVDDPPANTDQGLSRQSTQFAVGMGEVGSTQLQHEPHSDHWLPSDSVLPNPASVLVQEATPSAGHPTSASGESEWQNDQTLFPSLDGILSGNISIDEWLGTSFPFTHL